jgi:hypothetical protein
VRRNPRRLRILLEVGGEREPLVRALRWAAVRLQEHRLGETGAYWTSIVVQATRRVELLGGLHAVAGRQERSACTREARRRAAGSSGGLPLGWARNRSHGFKLARAQEDCGTRAASSISRAAS